MKDDNIHFRCVTELKKMAEEDAAKVNRTLSNYIVTLLIEAHEKSKSDEEK